PSKWNIPDAGRHDWVRQQAGRRHVALCGAHAERLGQELRALPAEERERLVERHAERLLGPNGQRDGEKERESEHRTLHLPPPSTAARSPSPSPLGVLICDTSTTPFSTTCPMSAMKPIQAETLRLSPATSSPTTPPTSANGTVARIRSAQRSEPKVRKRIARM